MKEAMGKKLWLHRVGQPTEIVISSHGCRDGDDLKTINLREFLPGTTVKMVVPDGTSSTLMLKQSVNGGSPIFTVYSYDGTAILFDYYLNKFQGERHGSPNETYAAILDCLGTRAGNLSNPEYLERQAKKNEKEIAAGFPSMVVDFVNRGVVTVRSGGRFSQQQVLLSEVIRAAQTPPFQFTSFLCNFCRVVV
jgi:hypothetical protein